MSSWELLALLIIALLVFGPERLPQLARTAGRTINRLRREADATLDEVKRATEYEELRTSANVDELRSMAREFTAEADRIRADARSLPKGRAPDADERTDTPAPFDPDAT